MGARDKIVVNAQDGEDFGCFVVVMWEGGETLLRALELFGE